MIEFAVFDELGRYLYRTQAATQESLALERQDRIYLGAVDIKTHYHDLATGQPVKMPEQPSENHRFDYAAKAWIDPRTLDELKALCWAKVKADRDAAIQAPLVTPLGTFDADERSALKITQAVLLANNLAAAGQPSSIAFTLADNTVASLSAAQMVQVGFALAAREQAARDRATALRAQIDAATAATDLQTIHFL